MLNKIHKWNQVALDCRALVNNKEKCTFKSERLEEIDECIKFYKFLDKVPEIAQVKEAFIKIKEWDAKILALTQTYPVDLVHMRAEIVKAKEEIL